MKVRENLSITVSCFKIFIPLSSYYNTDIKIMFEIIDMHCVWQLVFKFFWPSTGVCWNPMLPKQVLYCLSHTSSPVDFQSYFDVLRDNIISLYPVYCWLLFQCLLHCMSKDMVSKVLFSIRDP
jgi:hypothetical protein